MDSLLKDVASINSRVEPIEPPLAVLKFFRSDTYITLPTSGNKTDVTDSEGALTDAVSDGGSTSTSSEVSGYIVQRKSIHEKILWMEKRMRRERVK